MAVASRPRERPPVTSEQSASVPPLRRRPAWAGPAVILFPANHYVFIDDKLRILAAAKKIWGERVTTVFPKQGHYALDPQALVEYPAADIELARIADLMMCDLAVVLKKKKK